MKLSERTRQALNEQLMREIGASYLYRAMAAYLDAENLPGFARWMHRQSDEEWAHAMRFRTYLEHRQERARYEAVAAPDQDFSSPLAVFERAQESEEAVSAAIAHLYALAEEEKDQPTQSFLDWFVTEQVEEEKSVQAVIDWLKRVGDSAEGLFLLDQHLGGDVEGKNAETEAGTG